MVMIMVMIMIIVSAVAVATRGGKVGGVIRSEVWIRSIPGTRGAGASRTMLGLKQKAAVVTGRTKMVRAVGT